MVRYNFLTREPRRTKKKDIYVISTAKRPVPLEHYLYAGKELWKIVDASRGFLTQGYTNPNVSPEFSLNVLQLTGSGMPGRRCDENKIRNGKLRASLLSSVWARAARLRSVEVAGHPTAAVARRLEGGDRCRGGVCHLVVEPLRSPAPINRYTPT